MGAGPERLLAAGLLERLRKSGRPVEARTITLPDDLFAAEGNAAFNLAAQLSESVRGARGRGAWPLILSGNCGPAALGAIAGTGSEQLGIVWFDAHADFNTPETTASGFLDGMALATATGGCWCTMTAGVQGFEPVAPDRVVLVGARELDRVEAERLANCGIAVVPNFGDAFTDAIDQLARCTREIYLHLDLDVIDPSEGRANSYAAPGGLSGAEVLTAIELISERFSIQAASFTSYDPAEDRDGRIAAVALKIAEALVAQAAGGKQNASR